MESLKLLIVDDDQSDLDRCYSSKEVYSQRKNRGLEVISCKTVDSAFSILDRTIDGAIIDLRLGPEGNEGNRIIRSIHDSYRIPIVVFTGTPGNVEIDIEKYVRVYKKGEPEYEELFDFFFEVFNTGLTKILGGRGVIEESMNRVFWDIVLPTLDNWKTHVANGKDTEKALLRFTINHLIELLDEAEVYFPDEVYISPLNPAYLKTGTIVKHKVSKASYIVLSPACDLALHNGTPKTDRILICHIEKRESIWVGKKQDAIKRIMQNSGPYYYHYLPQTGYFEGGIINFRYVSTFTIEEFWESFESRSIQIAMAFIKDIVARFSVYYARQGQPDLDPELLK